MEILEKETVNEVTNVTGNELFRSVTTVKVMYLKYNYVCFEFKLHNNVSRKQQEKKKLILKNRRVN